MTVVIASDATEPEQVSHPGFLAPVTALGGRPVEREPLAATEDGRWQPELSPSGPVSIVLSQGSHRVIVYRNGIEIGQARLSLAGDAPFGDHVLVLTQSPSSGPDPYVPDPAKFRWTRIGVPGHAQEAGAQADPTAVARINLSPEFVRQLNAILEPGATLFVTDAAVTPQTSGAAVQVVDADPPSGKKPSHL
jgi:hypothetical protein